MKMRTGYIFHVCFSVYLLLKDSSAEGSVADKCKEALIGADTNQDNKIIESEYVNLTILMGPPDFLKNATEFGDLPIELRTGFNFLACLCSGDSGCCIGDAAHISIEDIENPTQEQLDYFSIVCMSIEKEIINSMETDAPTPSLPPTFAPMLEPSRSSLPTMLPSQDPVDRCQAALLNADGDQDSRITADEYVDMVKMMSPPDFLEGIDEFINLPLELRSGFNLIACLCNLDGGSSTCCMGDSAHILNEGIENPTPDQLVYIFTACLITEQRIVDALEEVNLAPMAVLSQTPTIPNSSDDDPSLDKCKDALIDSDEDRDDKVNQNEFVDVVKMMSPPGFVVDAATFENLPLKLRTTFNLLACLCEFDSGNISCCIGDAGHISTDGIEDPTQARSDYFSTVCFIIEERINDILQNNGA